MFEDRQEGQKYDTHQQAAKILYVWFLYVKYDTLGNRQDRQEQLNMRVVKTIIGDDINIPSTSPFRKHYRRFMDLEMLRKRENFKNYFD